MRILSALLLLAGVITLVFEHPKAGGAMILAAAIWLKWGPEPGK